MSASADDGGASAGGAAAKPPVKDMSERELLEETVELGRATNKGVGQINNKLESQADTSAHAKEDKRLKTLRHDFNDRLSNACPLEGWTLDEILASPLARLDDEDTKDAKHYRKDGPSEGKDNDAGGPNDLNGVYKWSAYHVIPADRRKTKDCYYKKGGFKFYLTKMKGAEKFWKRLDPTPSEEPQPDRWTSKKKWQDWVEKQERRKKTAAARATQEAEEKEREEELRRSGASSSNRSRARSRGSGASSSRSGAASSSSAASSSGGVPPAPPLLDGVVDDVQEGEDTDDADADAEDQGEDQGEGEGEDQGEVEDTIDDADVDADAEGEGEGSDSDDAENKGEGEGSDSDDSISCSPSDTDAEKDEEQPSGASSSSADANGAFSGATAAITEEIDDGGPPFVPIEFIYDEVINHQANLSVVGASRSGKSFFVSNIIRKIAPQLGSRPDGTLAEDITTETVCLFSEKQCIMDSYEDLIPRNCWCNETSDAAEWWMADDKVKERDESVRHGRRRLRLMIVDDPPAGWDTTKAFSKLRVDAGSARLIVIFVMHRLKGRGGAAPAFRDTIVNVNVFFGGWADGSEDMKIVKADLMPKMPEAWQHRSKGLFNKYFEDTKRSISGVTKQIQSVVTVTVDGDHTARRIRLYPEPPMPSSSELLDGMCGKEVMELEQRAATAMQVMEEELEYTKRHVYWKMHLHKAFKNAQEDELGGYEPETDQATLLEEAVRAWSGAAEATAMTKALAEGWDDERRSKFIKEAGEAAAAETRQRLEGQELHDDVGHLNIQHASVYDENFYKSPSEIDDDGFKFNPDAPVVFDDGLEAEADATELVEMAWQMELEYMCDVNHCTVHRKNRWTGQLEDEEVDTQNRKYAHLWWFVKPDGTELKPRVPRILILGHNVSIEQPVNFKTMAKDFRQRKKLYLKKQRKEMERKANKEGKKRKANKKGKKRANAAGSSGSGAGSSSASSSKRHRRVVHSSDDDLE